MSMDVRTALLEIIQEATSRDRMSASLQTNSILDLNKIRPRIDPQDYESLEQEILTQWHELFRTGYLAWGLNLSNPNPPFFHVTNQGKRAFQQINRDPANPEGYLRHLYSFATMNPISKSYLEEGLRCFVATQYKASAVMVGAASEAIILGLRDSVVLKIRQNNGNVSNSLGSWQVKAVLKGLKNYFDNEKSNFDQGLKEEYEAYWPAFSQQIRAVRNEVGHPSSIDPITEDVVHASFLIFPELAKLASKLEQEL